MNNIGLVFAGGGGKGAYEAGVWKYLRETGIDQKVSIVSGTSVGALNAAMFVGSDYLKTEEMWLNIRKSQVLAPRKLQPEKIVDWLVDNGVPSAILATAGGSALGLTGMLPKVAFLLFQRLQSEYIFSRDGLREMIDEGIDFDKLQNSKIDCYVTCLNTETFKIERFRLNDYNKEDIGRLLLATSAIPIVFKNEVFRGKRYCDGGFPFIGDNVPVQPVYDAGLRDIIVVHLNHEGLIDRSLFPDANIFEIVASEELGDLINGTLDFSKEGSKRRISLGYNDAKKVLEPIMDTFYKVSDIEVNRDISQIMYEKEMKRNEQLSKESKEINSLLEDFMKKI